MIFSYNELTKVERLMTHFYNKILLVDFTNDTYRIIKMDDEELKNRIGIKVDHFAPWIENFKNSEDSMNLNYNFDIDILKELESPIVLDYKKKINGVMKDVTMELVPIGDGQAYILVKDYSIKLPPKCEEDCDKCSRPC